MANTKKPLHLASEKSRLLMRPIICSLERTYSARLRCNFFQFLLYSIHTEYKIVWHPRANQKAPAASLCLQVVRKRGGHFSKKEKQLQIFVHSFFLALTVPGGYLCGRNDVHFFFLYILLSLSLYIYIYIFRHWLLSWFPHAWIYPFNSHPFGTQTSDNNESRHTSPKSVKYPNESIKSNFFFFFRFKKWTGRVDLKGIWSRPSENSSCQMPFIAVASPI